MTSHMTAAHRKVISSDNSWWPISQPVGGVGKVSSKFFLVIWRKVLKKGMGRKKEGMEVMPLPQGPVKNRSCTDVLCLLLFVFCIAGWAGVSYIGFRVSNFSLTKIIRQLCLCFRVGIRSCWSSQQTAPVRYAVKVKMRRNRSCSSRIFLSVLPCLPWLMAVQRHRSLII